MQSIHWYNAVCSCIPCPLGRRPVFYRMIVSLSFVELSKPFRYDTIVSLSNLIIETFNTPTCSLGWLWSLCGSKYDTPSGTLQPTTMQLPAIARREKLGTVARREFLLDTSRCTEVSKLSPLGVHHHLIERLPPWSGHRLHDYPGGTARTILWCPTCGAYNTPQV